MTAEQHQFYGGYLRHLADLLELRDWTIHLENGPLENPLHGAEIGRIYGRKHAVIRVSDEFFALDSFAQGQRLIHELLHCHLGGVQDAARVLSGALSRKAFAAWHPPFEHQLEFAIDALSDALVQVMPLPERVDDQPPATPAREER